MNRVEFKTTVHDGMIEIPKDSPEIRDREVKVVIMWEEKPVEKKNKRVKGKTKPEVAEFQKFLLSCPVMTDEEYEFVQEKRKHFNEWK